MVIGRTNGSESRRGRTPASEVGAQPREAEPVAAPDRRVSVLCSLIDSTVGGWFRRRPVSLVVRPQKPRARVGFLAFVEMLREVQWGWSQDEVAFVRRAGWQRTLGGGKSFAGHERRTYANPGGWRWIVSSLEGRLERMAIVVYWLEYDARATSPEIEQARSQVAVEYGRCLAVLRERMGLERYEGERSEQEARFQRHEDADRLAEWEFGPSSLTLCLCSGHLLRTRTPEGWLDGCWLELVLCPDVKQAEPGAVPDPAT